MSVFQYCSSRRWEASYFFSLVLNHYYCKSREDYEAKCSPAWRVDVSGKSYRTHRVELIDKAMKENNEVEDFSAVQFVPRTKEMLLHFGF